MIILIRINGGIAHRNPVTTIHRGPNRSDNLPAMGERKPGMTQARKMSPARQESQWKVSETKSGSNASKLIMREEYVKVQ